MFVIFISHYGLSGQRQDISVERKTNESGSQYSGTLQTKKCHAYCPFHTLFCKRSILNTVVSLAMVMVPF